MDELGDHHQLHKGLATMLAFVCFLLLPFLGVVGFLENLCIDTL